MTDEPALSIEDELENLVKATLKAAQHPDVKLSERLEVLKNCSQVYANLAKVKGKALPKDGDKTPTMGELRSAIDSGGDSNEGDDDDQ